MLTAADVEQKTFSTALRGYDLDEVDDFLDEIVATIRDLNDQLEAARDGAPPPAAVPAPMPEPDPEPAPEPEPAMDAEPEPASEPILEDEKPAIDEGAIGRALIAAQTAADKMLEEAETQATQIVDEARSQAETWETEKAAKQAEAEAEIARFTERVASVRAELAVLAEDVSTKLDDMDTVIEGRHSGTETAVGIGDELDGDDTQAAFDVGDDDELDDDIDSEVVELELEADEVEELESESTHIEDEDVDVDVDVDGEDASNADHLDDILNGVANDLQLGGEDDSDGPDDDLVGDSDEDE